MQKILVKATSDPFLFQWMNMPIAGVLASAKRETGTLAELSAELDDALDTPHIIFIAPAMSVHVRQLSFAAAEKKHLAKTVPFTLEDEMICDAADLHCVMTKPSGETIWVAAVQKQDLRRWLQQFEQVGLEVKECIPEQLLLLDEGNDWSMYYENGEFLIRCGEPQIHGVDGNNIALALELATAGYSSVPASINLILNEQADKQDALQQIPKALHSYLETEITPLPALIQQRSGLSKDLDLLQGEFSQAYDWKSQLAQWKSLLWVFLAALLVHTGVSFAEYRQSSGEIKQVRSEINSLYKKVFPTGDATNGRKKLEGELKRLTGGNSSSQSFLDMLLTMSPEVEKQTDFSMKAVNFVAEKGEIEVDLLLKDQSAVEALKTSLADKQLEVELLNSAGQDDQVRARMKLKSL